MHFRKLCIALVTVLLICTGICFAQESDGMTIRFVQSEPDENGVFTLDVDFDRMKFLTYQFAVRYNKNAVEPYSTQSGTAAKDFEAFADAVEHKGLNTLGEMLDVSRGLFTFTGYMFPGTEVEGAEKAGKEALTGKDFGLYTFTFRLLSENADPAFEIAFGDGNGEHYDFFPQGASVNLIDGPQNGTVVFEKASGKEEIPFDSVKYSPPPVMTKSRRLENTLYLQVGNYAAANDGALAVIDRDNKSVTPVFGKSEMLVPMRFVCEKFGLEVSWDEKTRISKVAGKTAVYEITPDKGTVTREGTLLSTGENVYIHENRIMIPISMAAEIAGLGFWYDEVSKAAVLTGGEEWVPDREAEKEALSSMTFVTSPFIKIFG